MVIQCFRWFHTLLGIYYQAPFDKVYYSWAGLLFQKCLYWLTALYQVRRQPAFLGSDQIMVVKAQIIICFLVKCLVFLGVFQHFRWDPANRHNDIFEEFVFIPPWEEGPAGYQLVNDAPQGPHVDWVPVVDPQHYLGSTVVPTLDVRES